MAKKQQEPVLASFVIMAYNEERFIEEAVKSAFAQSYSPLEIILSDDASKDNTYEIMESLAASYKGPHKVILNRNPKNLRISGHLNKVMGLASGDLFIKADGDDISLPERAEVLVHAWLSQDPRPSGVYSAFYEMTDNGEVLGEKHDSHPEAHFNRSQMVSEGKTTLGACSAWTRELFHHFGPLSHSLLAEDKAMALRADLCKHMHYVDKPLLYRRLGVSTWHQLHTQDDSEQAANETKRHWAKHDYLCSLQACLDLAHEKEHYLHGLALKRLLKHYITWQASELRLAELSKHPLDILKELLPDPSALKQYQNAYLRHSFPNLFRLGKALKSQLQTKSHAQK